MSFLTANILDTEAGSDLILTVCNSVSYYEILSKLKAEIFFCLTFQNAHLYILSFFHFREQYQCYSVIKILKQGSHHITWIMRVCFSFIEARQSSNLKK